MRGAGRSLLWGTAWIVGCSSSEPPPEPARVQVQQVLVGFRGSLGNYKEISRTQAEAEQLAAEVLRRAKAGEDFDALVQKYTDDRVPGIVKVANDGPIPTEGYLPRVVLPQCFGDLAFSLDVGEVGMASYDATRCPLGWHIQRRLE